MGNEFSWPCTDRKAQKRRLRESRYDQTLFEYATPRDSESDIPNLLEVESIVSQQRKYPKNPVATNSLATTKSSSGKTQHEFQENFDDFEGNDDFLPLLLTSRNMQPFDNFIRDLKAIYQSVIWKFIAAVSIQIYFRNSFQLRYVRILLETNRSSCCNCERNTTIFECLSWRNSPLLVQRRRLK